MLARLVTDKLAEFSYNAALAGQCACCCVHVVLWCVTVGMIWGAPTTPRSPVSVSAAVYTRVFVVCDSWDELGCSLPPFRSPLTGK